MSTTGAERRRGIGRAFGLAMAVALTTTEASAQPTPMPSPAIAELVRVAPGIDSHVLALALDAAACAAHRGLVTAPGVLTVIDYSLPSNQPRLWVLDVARRRLLYRDLVAHGRGSGELLATTFSNAPGSWQSSLGLFVTADVYDGVHGCSLRLRGLEPGINDNAFDRALVMHGADYVSPEHVATWERLGRSHGCPAVPLAIAPGLIAVIHGGTPVFAYYPDGTWLETSRFLAECPDAPAATRTPSAPQVD